MGVYSCIPLGVGLLGSTVSSKRRRGGGGIPSKSHKLEKAQKRVFFVNGPRRGRNHPATGERLGGINPSHLLPLRRKETKTLPGGLSGEGEVDHRLHKEKCRTFGYPEEIPRKTFRGGKKESLKNQAKKSSPWGKGKVIIKKEKYNSSSAKTPFPFKNVGDSTLRWGKMKNPTVHSYLKKKSSSVREKKNLPVDGEPGGKRKPEPGAPDLPRGKKILVSRVFEKC